MEIAEREVSRRLSELEAGLKAQHEAAHQHALKELEAKHEAHHGKVEPHMVKGPPWERRRGRATTASAEARLASRLPPTARRSR